MSGKPRQKSRRTLPYQQHLAFCGIEPKRNGGLASVRHPEMLRKGDISSIAIFCGEWGLLVKTKSLL
jgi:hypothetical protein